MVGVQGFEPRQAESESAVLPLDDTPVGHDTRARIMGRGPCGQGLVETGQGNCITRPPAAKIWKLLTCQDLCRLGWRTKNLLAARLPFLVCRWIQWLFRLTRI